MGLSEVMTDFPVTSKRTASCREGGRKGVEEESKGRGEGKEGKRK